LGGLEANTIAFPENEMSRAADAISAPFETTINLDADWLPPFERMGG
jgi:hypothetical protein